jgi:NAD-dependent SIR2 family protein deacetylase
VEEGCHVVSHHRYGRVASTAQDEGIGMKNDLDHRVQTLAQWLYESNHLVVFTGAGISTESGLPDFRGPDGMWTRRDKGLPPRPTAISWNSVEPNSGHLAIVALQKLDKLKFLISQNVDNLHLKSGIRPELLAELHGNMTKLRCMGCGNTFDRSSGRDRCSCGGQLRASVVDFGEPLPEKDLMRSFEHSRKSDLFVVVGSSLVVTPAADMPREALRSGARLVIINQGETPFDRVTHLRFREAIGKVLPSAVKRLKRLMGLFE